MNKIYLITLFIAICTSAIAQDNSEKSEDSNSFNNNSPRFLMSSNDNSEESEVQGNNQIMVMSSESKENSSGTSEDLLEQKFRLQEGVLNKASDSLRIWRKRIRKQ